MQTSFLRMHTAPVQISLAKPQTLPVTCSQEDTPEPLSWPAAVDVMGLMGPGEDWMEVSDSAGASTQPQDPSEQQGVQPAMLPRSQKQAVQHLGDLMGGLKRAATAAGPVELFV